MAATPQLWICPPASEPPPTAGVPLPDLPALAAALVPELSRLFGLHVTARATAGALPTDTRAADARATDAAPLLLARLPFAEEGVAANSRLRPTVDLLASPAAANALVDLLFGGFPIGSDATNISSLPPGSASWLTLGQFLGRLCTAALGTAGITCRLPVEVPRRASPDDGAPGHVLLDLDFDGMPIQLGLRLPRTLPAPVATVDSGWRQLVQARTREVALELSFRIAEQKMTVLEISRLAPGDVLPLQRPTSIEVLIGGQNYARIAVEDFHGRHPQEDHR